MTSRKFGGGRMVVGPCYGLGPAHAVPGPFFSISPVKPRPDHFPCRGPSYDYSALTRPAPAAQGGRVFQVSSLPTAGARYARTAGPHVVFLASACVGPHLFNHLSREFK